MSNASVGNIYHQIINEVIEASRVDFEDQGVGEEVLEELRKVCSFFPSCFFPYARHTHTHTHEHKPSGCCCRFDPICSDKNTAFFHLPRLLMQSAHRSRCWILCVVRVLRPSLARRCWLAMLAAWALCSQAALQGGGRWRGLRVRERRRVGRLGVRSDRRVTGCYLGLLSSTPACKIAFATPVNLPLHFDWSQLCPPSRAPKHDTRRG